MIMKVRRLLSWMAISALMIVAGVLMLLQSGKEVSAQEETVMVKLSDVSHVNLGVVSEQSIIWENRAGLTRLADNNVDVETTTTEMSETDKSTENVSTTSEISAGNISSATVSKISDKTYTGKNITTSVTVKLGDVTLKNSIDYILSYKNNKSVGIATVTIKGNGNYTGEKEVTFKILPKKVTSLKKSTTTAKTIKLVWAKQTGITGYVIYKYDGKTKKYKRVTATAKNSYVVKKLKSGTTYRFTVRAYKKTSEGILYGKYATGVKATTMLTTPKISVYSKRKGQARVSWQKVTGATGFELYYKKANGKYSKLNVDKKVNMYFFVELKEGARYTFRLRAYKTVSGKKVYSGYSTKTVKISSKGAPAVTGDYSVGSVYGPYLTQKELNEVKKAVQDFKDRYIDSSMPDYIKVLMAHDYLCYVCDYADDWSKNRANSAWGALVYGEAQCSGYARAMKALCDAAGIGCYYVHANSTSFNPSHQWNEVKVDGNWYIVDVQGDDTFGVYEYFLLSDKTYMGKSLMDWDKKSVPRCPKDYE
jgi:transglutaminase-like putative cysteine protease